MEEIRLVDSGDPARSWWDRYVASLREGRLAETSLQILEQDCTYIAERVTGSYVEWPDSRHRCGMVMGAVQSGKTASMLGVAAKCIDSDVNIVVVLAGTRLSLWRQTYERLVAQLDGSDPLTQALR
ncbi:MAG: hypothetical protein ACRD1T_01820, partial [Acidimicrobiia bacterium]